MLSQFCVFILKLLVLFLGVGQGLKFGFVLCDATAIVIDVNTASSCACGSLGYTNVTVACNHNAIVKAM